MRAIVKTEPGPGHLELQDVTEPITGPDQVKIRVMAAGICGTDVQIYQGDWPVHPPLILGHELAGEIVEVGPGVVGLSIGDRVTTETDAYLCGKCTYCRSGNEHLCPSRKAIGTTTHGGFADYLVIRAAGVHRLPDSVSIEAGALSEPLAVAVHAVRERGQVQPDELVIVIGPGTIGLLAAQVARAMGARVIVAGLARHVERFRLAKQLGIDHVLFLDKPESVEQILAISNGLGAHRVIECSGAPSSLKRSPHLLRKGGTIVLVGFFSKLVDGVDLDLLINKEISLLSSRGKRHSCWPIVIDLLANEKVNTEALITHQFTLAEWQTAFTTAQKSGTKVLLKISSIQPGGFSRGGT